MRFLFIDESQLDGKTIHLSKDQAHRLGKVLRLRCNDELIVRLRHNGEGYRTKVTELAPRKGQLEVTASLGTKAKASVFVHLGLALLKKKKLEMVVQKVTELGLASFTPLTSQNCVVKDLSHKECERLRQTAEEACQQSGRTTLPKLNELCSLPEFVRSCVKKGHKVFLFHQDSEKTMLKRDEVALSLGQELTIIVGPEGGFSEEEVEKVIALGANVRLLPGHILRAETAAIAATTLFSLSLA